MAVAGFFTPANSQGVSFGFASSNVPLPTGGTTLLVTNLGPCHIAIALSASATSSVSQSTGLIVLAGQSIYLGVGANTNIAGVACGGPGNSSTVNLSAGA